MTLPSANQSAKAPFGANVKGSSPVPGCKGSGRLYRLVDRQGLPHPVLDDLYDSLESAWGEALNWCEINAGLEIASPACIGIGVEVSTPAGSWRTLRHPC
jgi:hypothetical protein